MQRLLSRPLSIARPRGGSSRSLSRGTSHPDTHHSSSNTSPGCSPPAGRGGLRCGQGGASPGRQRLNNSGELSERNGIRCPPGQGGALGWARSRSLPSPQSPVSLWQGTAGPGSISLESRLLLAHLGSKRTQHLVWRSLWVCGGTGRGQGVPNIPRAHDGTCQTPAAPGTGDGVTPHKATIVTGPVRGGETPVAGWWIPQALPSPAFCIPTAPFPRRTAVPGHNGPFLPRHRRRLRSLGPFPGAEPPRWQPRRKNSSQ